jgi:hypothetical protein
VEVEAIDHEAGRLDPVRPDPAAGLPGIPAADGLDQPQPDMLAIRDRPEVGEVVADISQVF